MKLYSKRLWLLLSSMPPVKLLIRAQHIHLSRLSLACMQYM